MTRARRVGVLLCAIVIAAGLVYGYLPQPIAVDAVAAATGPLSVTVEEEGKTRVIDRFAVSAPVPGFAHRIDFDVGDAVEAGQVLVQIEPLRSTILDPRSRATARAGVEAADAALKAAQENAQAAEADAQLGESEVARLRPLASTGIVPQGELDRAESQERRSKAQLSSARFAVQVARFELEAARAALEYSAAEEAPDQGERLSIRAPVNGRILSIPRESEGVVQAGQDLLEIGDPRSLEIEVELLSADAVRVSPGTEVRFERWGGAVPLDGRVRTVEPTGFTKFSALGVEEQRVLVIADITSPPEAWERLGDGYRVEAHFVLWHGENVLQIPDSALFRHGDGFATFVVNGDGRAERRPVEVGHRSGLRAEILSGLAEGERVIPHPPHAVEDGVAVEPRGK